MNLLTIANKTSYTIFSLISTFMSYGVIALVELIPFMSGLFDFDLFKKMSNTLIDSRVKKTQNYLNWNMTRLKNALVIIKMSQFLES